MAKQLSTLHDVLIVCPPGLENILEEEIRNLGIRHSQIQKGGVSGRLTMREIYAGNIFLRTATRILVRIARFEARTFSELENQIEQINWRQWVGDEKTCRFRVTTRSSKLWHSDAISERFSNMFGTENATDDDQLFVVRAVGDSFIVSIDSSGKPLHERGWRQELAKAPLRESIAAGMLIASKWTPASPLVDPMCGSGTIVIEAALNSINRSPGLGRDMAFQHWPCFEPGTFASVTAEAKEKEKKLFQKPLILASDRDSGALAAAQSNAARAGVEEIIDWQNIAISNLLPPEASKMAGLILTNPPWGGRLSPKSDLRNLYATIGKVARQRFHGWQLGLLVGDRSLARQIRPGLKEDLRLEVGGKRSWFLTGEVN